MGIVKTLSALFITGASLAILSACGGGSSPTPPVVVVPPAPPVNQAPNVVITTSSSQIDEGQVFTIDASGSSDPEGAAVTISIAQTSGIDLEQNPEGFEPPTDDGVFLFRVPELTGDDAIIFEISVSDGTLTSKQTATITAKNIVLEPLADLSSFPSAGISPAAILFYFSDLIPDPNRMAKIRKDDFHMVLSGSDTFRNRTGEITVDDNPNAALPLRLVVTSVPDPGLFPDDPIHTGSKELLGSRDTHISIDNNRLVNYNDEFITGMTAIAIEDADFIEKIVSSDYRLSSKQPISIDSPCLAKFNLAFSSDDDSFAKTALNALNFRDIIIGQRNGGLIIYKNDGKNFGSVQDDTGKFTQESQRLLDTGSICHIINRLPTIRSIDDPNHLTAINFDDGEITTWSLVKSASIVDGIFLKGYVTADLDPGEITQAYTPFKLNIPNGQNITAVNSSVYEDGRTNTTAKIILAVTTSDGEHDGQHSLITLTWEFGENPANGVQQFFTWTKGVPDKVIVESISTRNEARIEETPDILVALETTPHIAIFNNTVRVDAPADFVFTGPEYAEVGLETE